MDRPEDDMFVQKSHSLRSIPRSIAGLLSSLRPDNKTQPNFYLITNRHPITSI